VGEYRRLCQKQPQLYSLALLDPGYAKSLMDYIARWLELRFLNGDQGELFKALPMPVPRAIEANSSDPVGALGELIQMGDAPACNTCGSLMVRSGTCYRCMTCGGTAGVPSGVVAIVCQPDLVIMHLTA